MFAWNTNACIINIRASIFSEYSGYLSITSARMSRGFGQCSSSSFILLIFALNVLILFCLRLLSFAFIGFSVLSAQTLLATTAHDILRVSMELEGQGDHVCPFSRGTDISH